MRRIIEKYKTGKRRGEKRDVREKDNYNRKWRKDKGREKGESKRMKNKREKLKFSNKYKCKCKERG